eukprot:CAMPEP_0172461594 /NCGR_PEP_ID=MMETSP1065-20121228/41096_1 /TAXON_ID=265537 /ORGANISM="Amphiprora paludosa, Strain CCMP125" /LENGTH=271 /DNA_ID=CAMNT_0013216979 /DNA_START=85 /DNA_END=900 /DNA_ORIENTATION=-
MVRAASGGKPGITVVKAGEDVPAQTPPFRAISAEEAPSIPPARESTKVTMMPWKGWFQRWLRDQIGEERFKQFREAVFFYPDDVYDLHPTSPSKALPISKDDPTLTRTYRYPSPGSEEAVSMPEFEIGEDPYDSAYYPRDTARRDQYSELGNPHVERLKLALLEEKYPGDPAVKAEIERFEAGPASSPGNKGVFATGPTTGLDPLRATMSANWKDLTKSLDDNMPDHIPKPIWMGREEEEDKHYVDRGIPAPFGAYYEPMKVPTWRRIATW